MTARTKEFDRVKVAVAGVAAEVAGQVVPTLTSAGHEVVTILRAGPRERPAEADLRSCDAVVTVADACRRAPLPRRAAAADQRHADAVRRLADAARSAGVRRLVHLGPSWVYADAAQAWVTEGAPVLVTAATDPATAAEAVVGDFAGGCRQGVVLRVGQVLGDSPLSRWMCRQARAHRAFGLGRPDDFAHVLHSDDLGPAVLAALEVPAGVYNVGAEPLPRRDLVGSYLAAAEGRPVGAGVQARSGRPLEGSFVHGWARRRHRRVLEPWERSLRVSSRRFADVSGWSPARPVLAPGWAVPCLLGAQAALSAGERPA